MQQSVIKVALSIYHYLSLFIESQEREQQKKCLKVKEFKFE